LSQVFDLPLQSGGGLGAVMGLKNADSANSYQRVSVNIEKLRVRSRKGVRQANAVLRAFRSTTASPFQPNVTAALTPIVLKEPIALSNDVLTPLSSGGSFSFLLQADETVSLEIAAFDGAIELAKFTPSNLQGWFNRQESERASGSPIRLVVQGQANQDYDLVEGHFTLRIE
jgi:hypothetical protein